MPTYHDVLAEVALRINAMEGATAGDLESNYTIRPLTTLQWRSARFPFSSAKEAILNAEEMIALTVAETDQHTWRQYLIATSSALATAASLPTTISSKPVIGIAGEVRDSSNSKILFEKDLHTIRRKANAFFTRDVYFYHITASRKIHHTRPNVTVDFCTYARDTQATSYDSDGGLLFPTAQPLYVAGALMHLTRDGRFSEQAAYYGEYFNAVLAAIRQGKAAFAPLASPAIAPPPA